MKPRTRRTLFVLSGLMSLGVATALILQAFESNLVFFFSPSQIAAKEAPQDRLFRVGGLVKEGSVERDPAG
ncbi:MAG: cytochrome c maturation protein CcmE, partial [Burkholderiaceae bacterium]|nr:cytochrome c maturation protein CcmE [Burkholderiaceae bacterium]